MKRKIVSFALIISFFIICSCNAKVDNLCIVEEYFKMKKDELINDLGEEFTIVGAGAEGYLDGYSYATIGLTFVFDPINKEDILWIDGHESFKVKGAHAGMNFVQIKQILGEAEIQEGWIELPEYITYYVEYEIGEIVYEFWSYNDDGSESMLVMRRKN